MTNLLVGGFGFILGYLLSWARYEYMLRRKRAKQASPERSSVIIEDDKQGQPEAREVLTRPSPIPRSLAIILVLLAALGLVSSAYEDHKRSSDDKNRNVAECQTLAQVVIRGNQGTAANAQLAKGLGQILTSKSNKDFIAALMGLQTYYASRSQQAKTLPPLPAAVIKDCADGRLDGTG